MFTETLYKLDKFLIFCLLSIATLGLTVLYAAVYQGDHAIFQKQCIYWGVGLIVFFSLCFLPLRSLGLIAWPFYIVSLLCLALVPIIGDVHMGARRWLDLGVVSFQPSEMMKWALMLVLAHWFASREPNTWKNFLVAVVLCGAPAALIVIQPDLGTTLVLLFAAIVMLMIAGFAWRWFFAALAASPIIGYFLWGHLHDYQKQRVLTFIDPQSDPLGSGYHVIQSMIAIGSGGLLGKGFLEGTQVRLHFLPEQHTDFIFSVFAEEAGLLGVSILLILYAMLISRMLSIAHHAHTRFGSLLVTGISAIFMIYAFINIGMVSGILPVVGVPLPFISYGGSALLTMITALGIVMRVSIESNGVIDWQRANNPLV
ncbi:MAG: rod shape-determining protein RodA [Mariprofundaceae bacterium]|nr:rod shape-determining protein RodA [Mariprofundaceae bacterium]